MFGRFDGSPSSAELARFFLLDGSDRQLVERRRGAANRLGFALQLCTVRFLGVFVGVPHEVPADVVSYVAVQLDVDVAVIGAYATREKTALEHQWEIRRVLGYAAIEHRIEQMNRALSSALDDAPDALIASMPINEKDRHVLALAVHVEADAVVTWNLRDFPASACAPHGIEELTPDQFLTAVATTDTPAVRDALDAIAARRRRPPMTTTAVLLDRLSATLPTFGTAVQVPPCTPTVDTPASARHSWRCGADAWPRATSRGSIGHGWSQKT